MSDTHYHYCDECLKPLDCYCDRPYDPAGTRVICRHCGAGQYRDLPRGSAANDDRGDN